MNNMTKKYHNCKINFNLKRLKKVILQGNQIYCLANENTFEKEKKKPSEKWRSRTEDLGFKKKF